MSEIEFALNTKDADGSPEILRFSRHENGPTFCHELLRDIGVRIDEDVVSRPNEDTIPWPTEDWIMGSVLDVL